MPWFKVDDTLPFHPKVLTAGNAAMGLWVRAGAWSAQQLTDGWIPLTLARTLGTTTEARRLISAGLWIPKDDGYHFHEWNADGRQPTRVEVEARREADRQRKADARAARHPRGQEGDDP